MSTSPTTAHTLGSRREGWIVTSHPTERFPTVFLYSVHRFFDFFALNVDCKSYPKNDRSLHKILQFSYGSFKWSYMKKVHCLDTAKWVFAVFCEDKRCGLTLISNLGYKDSSFEYKKGFGKWNIHCTPQYKTKVWTA